MQQRTTAPSVSSCSLSFSFHLPGEKSHIMPECGHMLHKACFIAVYGPPPVSCTLNLPCKSNLGICGICHHPMKVGDSDGGKSNKLAALTGMGKRNAPVIYPSRSQPSLRSLSTHPMPAPYDPAKDDSLDTPLPMGFSVCSGSSGQHSPHTPSPSGRHGKAENNYVLVYIPEN
ncbi:hypothetical protein K439DRAFT_1611710 [Ramaria rubella]|nr:hypothetical protein K439DRAFT_1611710 [Ramaria rubella]